jgi:hypothetical protein
MRFPTVHLLRHRLARAQSAACPLCYVPSCEEPPSLETATLSHRRRTRYRWGIFDDYRQAMSGS